MRASEKRKKEQVSKREKRMEEIIEAAISLFSQKGIENTSIVEIANKAEVGVVSIYRYFNTKTELVIASATAFSKRVIQQGIMPLEEISRNSCLLGIEKVTMMFEIFPYLFRNHGDFLRFLEEFDNYVMRHDIGAEQLKPYEDNLLSIRPIFMEIIKEGKKDGTINPVIREDIFYMAITHSLMALTQKLLLRGKVLETDHEISAEDQIYEMIQMTIYYLKNRP